MDAKPFPLFAPETPEENLDRRLKDQARRDRQRARDKLLRRWIRPSDWLMFYLTLLLALLCAIYAGILFERFTPAGAVRHLAALGGCGAARTVGAAPATRGEIGYWPYLDINGDGVACSG